MAWFHKKKKKTEPENNPAPVQVMGDEELAAVLAGAIAAYLGTVPGNIAIRSWRQVSPAWRRSAREIQIFHRF